MGDLILNALPELKDIQRQRYMILARRFDCTIELVDEVPELSAQFTTIEVIGHMSNGYLVAKFDTRGH